MAPKTDVAGKATFLLSSSSLLWDLWPIGGPQCQGLWTSLLPRSTLNVLVAFDAAIGTWKIDKAVNTSDLHCRTMAFI